MQTTHIKFLWPQQKRRSSTYIRTVGVGSNNLTVLREFPDSVNLQMRISHEYTSKLQNKQIYAPAFKQQRDNNIDTRVQTSPGWMMVLYFFTNGERASSLNWTHTFVTRIMIIKSHTTRLKAKTLATWEMCSAAATRGLTTSQFAMTRVLGTLPSV